jgi:hypothetical protein
VNVSDDDETIQIGGRINQRRRHELIERLAVPTFDWVSGPIVAMAEALAPSTRADLSADEVARPRRRWLILHLWHRSGVAPSG